eukprot:6186996-Pleurochrysis_carterae.AAC.4
MRGKRTVTQDTFIIMPATTAHSLRALRITAPRSILSITDSTQQNRFQSNTPVFKIHFSTYRHTVSTASEPLQIVRKEDGVDARVGKLSEGAEAICQNALKPTEATGWPSSRARGWRSSWWLRAPCLSRPHHPAFSARDKERGEEG